MYPSQCSGRMPAMAQRSAPTPRFTFDRRASGLLLHPTSLPGPFGSGDLGAEAHAFADFLAAAGQRWWQMLPVGPPGEGNSPYSAASAFAGSPALVSPELLVERGLARRRPSLRRGRVQRAARRLRPVDRVSRQLLRQAFERFRARGGARKRRRFAAFVSDNAFWLDDFALFTALKRRERRPPVVAAGDRGIRTRKPAALAASEVEARRRDPVPAVRPVRVRPPMAVAARVSARSTASA